MEIIELSSEPSDNINRSPPYEDKHDIIELTDDADPSSQVQAEGVISEDRNKNVEGHLRTNDTSPKNPSTADVIIYGTQETSVNSPRSSPKKSILDLNNWISSSDDDSLIKQAIQDKGNSSVQSSRRNSLLKKVLLSSPISERISQSQCGPEKKRLGPLNNMTTASSPDKIEAASSIPVTISDTTCESRGTKRTIISSDPIVESDHVFSSPKKKTANRKKASTKATLTKEWREANKSIRRKNDLLKEMVIEISQVIKEMIQTDYFQEVFALPQVRTSYLDVPLISWKRRVKARYNKEQDIFVPCELTEICEKPLILIYQPADLVSKIKDGSIRDDIEISRRKSFMEDPMIESYVVILVPGFKDFLRKLQSLEDKKYRQNLLSQLNESRTKVSPTESTEITAGEASQLLIDIEVNMGINVFLTKSLEETIDWLHSFTHTIGSSLYDKFERNSGHSNFGNVRSGSDRKSTFIEMVKKFNLMTAPKAQHLYQYYESIPSLYDRYKEHQNLGTVNGKSIIPPTVNTSMMRVFTARDCDMVITE